MNFSRKWIGLALVNFVWNNKATPSNSWGGCSIIFTKILVGQRGKIPVGFPPSCYPKILNIVLGIIFTTFQGELRVETQQVLVRPDSGSNEKPKFDIDRGMSFQRNVKMLSLTSYPPELKTSVSPFLFLAVDLPPPPLFQDAVEKNIIPQVSIHSVLAKYDGRTAQVGAFMFSVAWSHPFHLQESAGQLRQYKCQRLPPYIILHFKRFAKNAFVEEKNPTIVNFPLLGLDFKECMY